MADNSLTFKMIGTQISGDLSGPFSQTPFLFCLARLVDHGELFIYAKLLLLGSPLLKIRCMERHALLFAPGKENDKQ